MTTIEAHLIGITNAASNLSSSSLAERQAAQAVIETAILEIHRDGIHGNGVHGDGAVASDVDAQILTTCLKKLRNERLFGELFELSTHFAMQPSPLFTARHYRAQAAVELKLFPIAMREMYAALGQSLSDADRGEAETLLGRINKQQYVDTASSDADGPSSRARAAYLQAAIEEYAKSYVAAATDRSPQWSRNAYFAGGNVVALLWRAELDQVAIKAHLRRAGLTCFTARELAHELLEDLIPYARLQRKTGTENPDLWAIATAGEVLLAADPAEAAMRGWRTPQDWMAAYARRTNSPFMLYGTTRQLEEVWLIEPGQPNRSEALEALKAATARHHGDVRWTRAELQSFQANRVANRAASPVAPQVTSPAAAAKASDDDAGYERQVDGVLPMDITWVYRMLDWSGGIGRVRERGKAKTIGTGFLFNGDILGIKKYRRKTLFLTNSHVVSSIRAEQLGTPRALAPNWAEIVFGTYELGNGAARNDKPLVFKKPEVVWTSPRDVLDASILDLGDQKALQTLMTLPLLDFDLYDTAGANVSAAIVVGYPDGGDLCFSHKNNYVREFGWRYPEQQQHRFAHYKSSTDKGQSGSPVFNEELFGVYALHHYGPQEHHSGGGDTDAPERQMIAKLNNARGLDDRPIKWVANQGILIKSIISAAREDLGADKPGVLSRLLRRTRSR